MAIDKEIVKMDKAKAAVVGLTIDCRKIFTEYFEEVIEELCYHALAKEWGKGEDCDPAASFEFIEENVKDMLLKASRKIAHRKMLEIIAKGAKEIKREIFTRCFGEDVPLDDEPETANEESVAENEQ